MADAYLAFVTAWNAKASDLHAQYGDGGSDPATLKAMWNAYARLGEEFVTGLDAIAWPPELKSTVERVAAANAAVALLERELASDPTNADLMSKLDAALTAHTPIAQELRSRLGLPPVPTEPPLTSPSPTPAPTR